MAPLAVTERVERLNRVSAKRVIDPEVDLPGSVGDGQLLPDELLSVHGLGLDLSVDQRRTLGREEVASILDNGIRFEAVLEAGFALLDGWATWKAVNRLPERLGLLQQATRPVLAAMLDAGVVRPGRVPSGWQELCAVDAAGRPTA